MQKDDRSHDRSKATFCHARGFKELSDFEKFLTHPISLDLRSRMLNAGFIRGILSRREHKWFSKNHSDTPNWRIARGTINSSGTEKRLADLATED